ncbi:hypothetical protein EPO44_10320 [bacterium]|nr:MAG: hypothetical protein EPO44_10320 [bacterium]
MTVTCSLCHTLVTGATSASLDPEQRRTEEYYLALAQTQAHLLQFHLPIVQQGLVPVAQSMMMFMAGKLFDGIARHNKDASEAGEPSDFDQAQRQHMKYFYWLVTGKLVIDQGASAVTNGLHRAVAGRVIRD